MSTTREFAAMGLLPPRSTALDRRASLRSAVPPSGVRRSTSSRGPAPRPPADHRGAVLAEHRQEMADMLSDAVGLLRGVYRSKFTLGKDTLRQVDPNFGADAVGEFNLAESLPLTPLGAALAAVGEGDGVLGGGAGDEEKDRLRAAEDLVKKLFQRNAVLEAQNHYLNMHVATVEQYELVTGKRPVSLAASLAEGHIPLDHPSYQPNMRRRCRSVPPQRTLMRSAADGEGLVFPPVDGPDEDAAAPDPPAVAQLRSQVVTLTEALVAAQHDNERLHAERGQRDRLRDALLQRFLVEHDKSVAGLHALLHEAIDKVRNPIKMARTRQPPEGLHAAVVANNVVREVTDRLAAQISDVTAELISAAETATVEPVDGCGGGTSEPPSLAHAAAAAGARQRDLERRLAEVVDGLPMAHRKRLLLLLRELRVLFCTLADSNAALVEEVAVVRRAHDDEARRLKVRVAVLRDQLRAAGIDPA